MAERLRRQTANLIPSGCAGCFDLFSLSPLPLISVDISLDHLGTSEDGTTDRKSECVIAPRPPAAHAHLQSLFFACAGLLGSEDDGPRHKMTQPPLPPQGYIQRKEMKTPKGCADAINKNR